MTVSNGTSLRRYSSIVNWLSAWAIGGDGGGPKIGFGAVDEQVDQLRGGRDQRPDAFGVDVGLGQPQDGEHVGRRRVEVVPDGRPRRGDGRRVDTSCRLGLDRLGFRFRHGWRLGVERIRDVAHVDGASW